MMAATEKQLTLRRLKRNNALRKAGFCQRKMMKGMCREESNNGRNFVNDVLVPQGIAKRFQAL